ncbi:hypothetical protein [Leptolyngbya sp. BC1307]|uniref:hypothetical protein n=1 Tax=Leptolyngbya sp. BC1307 TaxID=2029589 RepID=UPI000EFB3B10|nr:hypothetical protein [Leptolyngbya sp. BC1307]
MSDFGIILACYQRDYSFVKGCCASIRYFLGEVPLCLIVDGSFSTEDLQKTYGVQTIYRSQVSQAVLRDKKYTSSTKMIAFWESPWENFLYLDADMVVWGDLLKFSDFESYDMVVDRHTHIHSEAETKKWFFDGDRLETFFPDYQWRERPYFCTGIFFAKRGLFSLKEYERLINLKLSHPKLFYGMDQGLLNLMIFRAADQEKIRLGFDNLQIIVPDFSVEYLGKTYLVKDSGPNLGDAAPIAIHWSGEKPFASRSSVYSKPMSFFRHKFLEDAGSKNQLINQAKLQLEDFNVYKHKLLKRVTTGHSTSMLSS